MGAEIIPIQMEFYFDFGESKEVVELRDLKVKVGNLRRGFFKRHQEMEKALNRITQRIECLEMMLER